MALKKDIEQENGVILSYHRIAEIENIVNDSTKLKIISYVNQKQRQKEINAGMYGDARIYIMTSEEKLNYNDTLSIKEAYNYLKTTDTYKGAEDVFEEDDLNS